MKKTQEAKLWMLEASVSVMEEGNSFISQVPVLAEKTVILRDLISQIRKHSEEYKIVTIGKTVAKNSIKESIIKLALIAAGGLYSYGLDKNDLVAAETGNLKEYDLRKLREDGIVTVVKNILEKTSELGNALESYGVSPQMLDTLKQGVNDYYSRLSAREIGLASRVSARKKLIELFEAADKALNATDRLMMRFKNENSLFYNRYLAARVIRDKAVNRRELQHK